MADSTPKLAACGPDAKTVTGWTLVFMVLLRIAIGWHLFYEGVWKLHEGNWSAAPYLIASAGPLRPVFHWMVKDPEGLERMTKESIHNRIDQRYERITKHYKFEEKQLEGAEKFHKQADAILAAPDFQKALADYKARVEGLSGDPDYKPELVNMEVYTMLAERDYDAQVGNFKNALEETNAVSKVVDNLKTTPTYEVQRLSYDYRKKAQARALILARIEKPLKDMEAELTAKASMKQLEAGPPPRESSQTPFIDWSNMWGLTLAGACLMLGLFTRFAALSGACLLMLYYLAQPPFPGLPEVPMSEGHYLIVNKNLIEFLALMMFAVSGVGRWGGLDAYISRLFCRNACKAPAEQPA